MCVAQILGGLLPELEALQEQGFQADTNSATRSIGYRQGLKWLQDVRKRGAASAADIKQLALDIQGPSRRLHKAQVTFHRDTEHFHWVDASAGPEAAAARIERQLQLEEHQGAHSLLSCAHAASIFFVGHPWLLLVRASGQQHPTYSRCLIECGAPQLCCCHVRAVVPEATCLCVLNGAPRCRLLR